MQSIYEAAQPDDNQYNTRTGGPSNIPYSPSAAMVTLPEETASLYSSRAPSRAQMYTPEPPIAPYSNHSPSLSSPLTPYSPFNSMPSPQPMTTSSSSASSHTSTPTPVSGVGFASSSAAEFYAARDAVMRGNGLFGGGGLEREIHSTQLGMTPRKSRVKRYTTTAATTSTSRNGLSDSESQHSASNDGHDAFSPKNVTNIPPVPKIIKQQEEEYDPFRPRDSDDEGDDVQRLDTSAQSGYNASSDLSKNENEDIENEELVVPPHLDVPMSKNQFKRISRALQDIESELTKSYSFINMPSSSANKRFSSTLEESNEDTQRQQTEQSQSHHQYEDYDLSPSDEDYNSSGFDHHHHNYLDDHHHHDHNSHERTFHSSTSGGSNSSEYHHQHSSKAPFVYDDTDEIDPPLNRLPSQHDLQQRMFDREEELGRNRDEYVDEQKEQKTTDHPRIEFDSEDRQEEEEQSAFESRVSSSTRQSDSTTIPTGRAASRAATHSTSTLDVIIDGKEDQYHYQQQDSRSLRPMYNAANARLSASSEISKPASSPGLPYLQATPPVQAFEFPSPSLTSSIESTNPVQQTHQSPPSTSSDSFESANMNASNSNHTISSVTTSYSNPPSASNLRQQVQLQSQQGPPRGNIPVSAIPVTRLLQTTPSPAHSRENSASSSIYNPPLSPPPQCGLPPLPSSASGHSLASIKQTSAHSKMPSMDSLTMLAQTASVQDEDKMTQEEQEKAEGRVPFPAYDRHEHNTSASPEAHSSREEQETSHDNRHDSIQSSSADTDSRRYSNTSVGSSWRGGPSHGRSLSSSTVDFELSNLPLSPSKATHRMTNIEEDVDEDELSSSEIQEEERKKAIEYLRNHAPDLDMADLRDIHERLVQSALQQREDYKPNMISTARGDGLEKRINGEPHEEQQAMSSSAFTSEVFASEAMPLEKETLEQPAQLSAAGIANVKLGSPFMEQNGFGEQREAAQGMCHLMT